jgi:nickel-dependent lactate racemase
MIGTATKGEPLEASVVRDVCATELQHWNLRGRRVLAVVPDGTRTAPMDVVFPILHEIIAPVAAAFDVLIALGTHPPMTDDAINERLGITNRDRQLAYSRTKFMNHRYGDPNALVSIGTMTEDEIESISGGRLRERVVVTINRLALEYDLLLIVGPTFPHEVAGFSGGNKYLFPGISGKEIIDMFHWLGALLTNCEVIGKKQTPIRTIIDKAAAMVPVERKCVSLVVREHDWVGLYLGTPEEAWSAAADLSAEVNIKYVDRAIDSVLSCAPAMYEELWVAGKCAYKLEPVVADGGELIIYAPHLARLSATHGETIAQIGYHVRDYFVRQRDRFARVPRGIMAHSSHVKGVGTFEGGVERPRIRVTLATRIDEATCRAINLDYRDPRAIDAGQWNARGTGGRLLVPQAGETLFRLKSAPPAAPDHAAPQESGLGRGMNR